MGSHFALGECFLAQDNYAEALEHYLAALKTLDLTTVGASRAESLRHVYNSLADSMIEADKPEKNRELCESLSDFLGQSGWREKVQQARESLDRLTSSEAVLSIAELVSRPDATGILQSVARDADLSKRASVLSRARGAIPHHRQGGGLPAVTSSAGQPPFGER